MRTVLISLRQWGVVIGTTVRPTPADARKMTEDEVKEQEAWESRTAAAFMEISLRVADSVLAVLGDTQDPTVAWCALEKRYGAKQEGLQSNLISKLQLASWDGTGAIHTHRDYMVDLRIQLAEAGKPLDDQSFYSYFKASLPSTCAMFVYLYKNPTYDVDDLCNTLAGYEMEQQVRVLKDGKTGAAADTSVALFGQQSKGKDKDKGKKKRRERDLTNVTCHTCGKKGHLKYMCPDKKDEKGKGKEKEAKQGEGSSGEKAQAGTLYPTVSKTALLANTKLTSFYYIDSGASDHLVPSKGELRAYKEFARPVEIGTADDGKIQAYGTGSLQVVSSVNGLERQGTLEDVYYTPGVQARLISLGKLQKQGWDIRIREDGMVLRDRAGDVFADIDMVNNVFPTKLRIVSPGNALVAWTSEYRERTIPELVQHLQKVAMAATARGGESTEATLMTWHRRLGHSSFKSVVALAKNGASGIVITDIPAKIPGLDACAACVAGKSVHLPHKQGRQRASRYLERVHIDIAGPMPVKSAGGKEYLYVVVDDYTRAVHTRALRLKSEAVEAFKDFKAVVENASGYKLCEVMTDNARELSMGEMRELCEREGIKLNTTVPYHPASNGVAERAIGVLTNSVRAMLHDSGLPKSLWAEAFSTATYVHNRTPTTALGGLTPYEVLYETRPNISDLRAFGAPCAIVQPAVKLKKLDDRTNMCFFLGYKYGGGGYRVWRPEMKVVVEARDVVFFEEGLPSSPLHLSTQDDDDDPMTQQPPEQSNKSVPIDTNQPREPAPAPAPPTTTTMTQQPVPTPEPQERLVVRLPGRYMNRPSTQHLSDHEENDGADTSPSSDDDTDDEDQPTRPRHDVSHVPDYPMRTTRSGLRRDGGGGITPRLERNGGGGASAMLVMDDECPPVAFSAGLPNGIQLAQLPDPRNVREAMAAPDADQWKDAMGKEMANLKAHDVYELVPRTPRMRTLRLGWVLHRKFKNGVFEKNKARLVARGNHQRPGVDYNESFSPVMRLESLRTLLAVAAISDFDIMQFDVTSAYLHGTIKEELYMEQPDGHAVTGKENWVWKLKKGLYGLVQAGRTWNEELNSHMESVGYSATSKDPAVYVKGSWNQEDFAAGGFWVDDFIGIGSGAQLEALAKSVDAKYGITGLGEVKWVLGMLVERDRSARTISISQEAFINLILARFNFIDATPLSTPLAPGTQLTNADCPQTQEEKDEMATRPYRELVGALAWLALGTRPDIAYATSSLARFGHNPGRAHWEAAKRVLRYLKGTRGWKLTLGGKTAQIASYTDADWGSDRDDR